MSNKQEPKDILDLVISIIESDISVIKNISSKSTTKQLKPQTALTLTRYAKTLAEIEQIRIDRQKDSDKALLKMTTEELLASLDPEKRSEVEKAMAAVKAIELTKKGA